MLVLEDYGPSLSATEVGGRILSSACVDNNATAILIL